MGFIKPSPPPFDLAEWRAKPYLSRLKANVQEWAVNGFGTASVAYLLYTVKLVVYAVGALALISATTRGLGGLSDIGAWWTEPIVFQKLAVWTLLWGILGLGEGSMPLTLRFLPPIGGILYWLRPGTVRLPPWPGKVPLTRGSRRTLVDVVLYAAVLGAGGYLMVADGEAAAGTAAGYLDPVAIAALLGLLAILGLRDKAPFLAARPEVYGFLLVVSLFPSENQIAGWQLAFVCVWWGAAASKLNRHFPYTTTVMISNTPWYPRFVKTRLWKRYPEDVRPSLLAGIAAHIGTALEFGPPLVLLLSGGGWIGTIALIVMLVFHIHITLTFPFGVPLEWNLFMIFGLLFLFGAYADVPLASAGNPLMLVAIVAIGVLLPIAGNLRPDKISFLPGMRYYAGNWPTSLWLFRRDAGAEEKLDHDVTKSATMPITQLTRLYGPDMAGYLMEKVLAFRAMHSHGRALNGLLARAVQDVDEYDVRDGEWLAGAVAGWNFGEGHLHHEQLLEAVQEQCGYEDGDLRVVMLESQPAHIPRQRYRIHDAASGLIEEGWVDVAEMVKRGPRLEESFELPVEVTRRSESAGRPATVR